MTRNLFPPIRNSSSFILANPMNSGPPTMPSSSSPPGIDLLSTRDEFTNYFFSSKRRLRSYDTYYHPMYVYSQEADAVADRILQGASNLLGVQPVVGPCFPRAELDRALRAIPTYASLGLEGSTLVMASESGDTDISTMPEVATSTTSPRPTRNLRNARRNPAPGSNSGDRDLPKTDGAAGDAPVKPSRTRRRGPKEDAVAADATVTAGKKDPLVVGAKETGAGGGRRRGNRHNTAGDGVNHGPDEFADMDFSNLNFNEPPPTVVSELPNGHGVTIIGTRQPTGEITTRMKYDRQLMLALSHSPFSLAHPDGYTEVVLEMDEIVPPYPRRYIPREYCSPVEPTPAPGV
uniref:IPT/TIG domain-containing protein n=1 Tax=Panagrellus redivivus TaxID=6233 RepID=A0A7E4V9T4_PANRE